MLAKLKTFSLLGIDALPSEAAHPRHVAPRKPQSRHTNPHTVIWLMASSLSGSSSAFGMALIPGTRSSTRCGLLDARPDTRFIDDGKTALQTVEQTGLDQPAGGLFERRPTLIVQAEYHDSCVAADRIPTDIGKIEIERQERSTL